MNKKITTTEVMTILMSFTASLFYAFVNIRILSISKNTSLIAVLISIILGIIPVLMITNISKHIKTNFFDLIKEKFKILKYPIFIILTLIAIYIVFINSWIVTDFIISQFLTKDSYYFISLLFSLLVIIAIKEGIETISRTIFILFIFTIIIIFFFFGTLIPYIDIENFKPIIDTTLNNTTKGIILCLLSTTSPLIYILNLKEITIDKENFKKKILISYLLIMTILFSFLFFLIGVYGIDLASILTYPSYALFKKVQILGFIERIENISAIIFITAYFTQFVYFIYIIKDNIKKIFKIKNKKKVNTITYLLILSIPIISIYLFKTYEITNIINYTPYIFIILLIIIFITFIKCLKN